MSFDDLAAFKAIKDNENIVDADHFMIAVIDVCQSLEKNDGWHLFKQLSYQVESNRLANHVVSALSNEKSPINEKGFWFGINNPVLENGETSAGIYFSVSSEYDPEDEELDWACCAEFYPEYAVFPSQVMRDLYEIAYKKNRPW